MTSSSNDKRIVLITGANGGIGFEIAGQLASRGSYHVLLGARSVEKGNAALQDLRPRGLPGTVDLIEIGVTNDASISNAPDVVRKNYGHLDCLINNAGTAARTNGSNHERMNACLDTNAIGAALIGDAFATLLLESLETPRIVNISSASGSITHRLDSSSPSYKMPGILQYLMSKAAMNMVSADQWAMLDPNVKVFAWCPGFTVSNCSDRNTAATGAKPANEAVLPVIDIIEGKRDAEAGGILSSAGVIPW